MNEYLIAVRRRWHWLVVAASLGTLIAFGASFVLPKQYEASVELFVSTAPSAEQDAGQMLQGSNFALQRVKSYAEAITSSLVLAPVIEELELDMTTEQLSRQVTSEVPLDTVLIRLAVVDEDPERAALLADEVAAAFGVIVPQLEQANGADSPVTVIPLSAAVAPTDPMQPRLLVYLTVGFLLGLLAGLALILTLQRRQQSLISERISP